VVGGGAVPMALEARSGKSACPDKNTTVSKPSFWLVLHFQRRMPPKGKGTCAASLLAYLYPANADEQKRELRCADGDVNLLNTWTANSFMPLWK
jgi:hypothetical protein